MRTPSDAVGDVHKVCRAASLIVALLLLASAGCGAFGEDSFSVGDCVELSQRTVDSDLTEADCPNSATPFDTASSVYRVQSVEDGHSSSCSQSLTGVEFSHEPHDKTYCLVPPSAFTDSEPAPDDVFTGDGQPPECTDAELNGDPLPEFCP